MKNLKKGMLIVFTALVLSLTACTNNTESFKIKFDTNGGSKVETEIVEEGNKATKPISPTKDGYIFDGWYLDKDFKEEYDFRKSIDKDVTLYAKWKENTCGIVCSKGYTLTADCKCVKEDKVDNKTTTKKTTITTNKSNDSKTTKKITTTTSTTTKKTTEAKISSAEIPYSKVELTMGESIELSVNIKPTNAKVKNITWSSSNGDIATVDNKGVVRTLKDGTVTIKVSVDGKEAQCTIVVNKVYTAMWFPVKDSAIGQHTLYITDNEGHTMSGTVTLTTIDDKEVTESIPKEGKVYVKSIIKDVKVLKVSKEA